MMENDADDPLVPENLSPKKSRPVAVALRDGSEEGEIPRITAAGRGLLAEKILDLAFQNGVKVREDADLAEMLTSVELDSPIPSEAFLAVAEILSYVYRASNAPDPYDAVFGKEE